MPVKVYHLKDALLFKDRVQRKTIDTSFEFYRVIVQAPWIWVGLVTNSGKENESVEWQGSSIHNVARVEGEPDAELVEPTTSRSFGKAPARTKEQSP